MNHSARRWEGWFSSRYLAGLVLLLSGSAFGCGREPDPQATASRASALGRATLERTPPETAGPETRAAVSEPDPPDEVLEPGPVQRLWLAPPTEVLDPDPDLSARLAATALKRRDERRLEAFAGKRTVGAIWGTVVGATSDVFDSDDDPAGFVATRYQIKRQRSWKSALPDVVEVWAAGGQHVAVGKSDGPPRDSNHAGEAYFSIGQEVLLSLRLGPLYPGDVPRLRVGGGSSGALVAVPESKTDSSTLAVFAKSLDERLPGY